MSCGNLASFSPRSAGSPGEYIRCLATPDRRAQADGCRGRFPHSSLAHLRQPLVDDHRRPHRKGELRARQAEQANREESRSPRGHALQPGPDPLDISEPERIFQSRSLPMMQTPRSNRRKQERPKRSRLPLQWQARAEAHVIAHMTVRAPELVQKSVAAVLSPIQGDMLTLTIGKRSKSDSFAKSCKPLARLLKQLRTRLRQWRARPITWPQPSRSLH